MDATQAALTAENLFLDYVAAEELGEKPDFEALQREHPTHAEALRELKSEYDDAQRVFVRLGMGAELDASLRSKWREAREAAAQSHVDHEELMQSTIPTLERLRELGPHAARYERLGQINRGGMGAIVKVHDKLLRRTLALKEMLAPKDEHQRARLRSRFLEEAEITGRLEHPGIVPVHEMGLSAENGEPFFTMKLVKGRDLDVIFELVARGDREWTQTRVVQEVLLRVCETMSYAHAQGVIHRDLKPSNVRVGAYGEVYVMDWGLARAIGKPESDGDALESSAPERDEPSKPGLTRQGHRVGTPQYMAPEQARGDNGSVGPATDIYAVGVMLYRLIAGRTPYVKTGESPGAAAVLERVLAGPPTPLGELASRTAPELVAICERAMAREIGDRYASMSALAAELRAYVEGRVVGAYETGTWAETKKWVTRNKPLAASLSIAFVLLVAGLTTSLILKAQSDENALLAERRAGETAEQARIAKANEEKATQREQEALASARRAERVTEFVQDALISSDPNQGGAEKFRVVEAMDAVIAELERGELKEDPATEASLQATLSRILNGNGRSEEGLQFAERALASVQLLHVAEHPDVVDSLDLVASCLQSLGRSDEALPKWEESLAMSQRLFSGDHPNVAGGLNNVGSCLDYLGRSDEALPKLEESLAMYERLFSGDHPGVANGLNNVGSCLDYLGRSDEALPKLEESLAMYERLFSGDHPDVANGLNNVAGCLRSLGRTDEALPKHEESLAMYQRLFSGDHPDVASGLNNVGSCLDSLGRSDEALPRYEESLAMFQRLFASDHASTATSLSNLATCLRALGKSEEALVHATLANEMATKVLPVGHPLRVQIEENLETLRQSEPVR
jgi:serine/threonine protein kinase